MQSSTQTTAPSVDKSAASVSANNGTSSNVAGNAVVKESYTGTIESKEQSSAGVDMAELAANDSLNVDKDADQVTNGTTESAIEEEVASNSMNESVDGDNVTAANLDESVSTNHSEEDEAVAEDDE